MTDELIEHTVEVDDHILVTLKIPKVLNAMELQGLMEKSRKLMSLASTPTGVAPPKGRRTTYTRVKYTPEMDKLVKKVLETGTYKDAANEVNLRFSAEVTEKTLYARVKRLKKLGEW